MRFFFSVMQFHATAGCLIGVRRYSTQFFYVWIIHLLSYDASAKNLALTGPLSSPTVNVQRCRDLDL